MDNNYQYESQNTEVQASGQNSNGLAIASLVCGILAMITMCCCTYLGIILGIVAIVTGAMSKDEYGKKPTMAKVGIVLGIAAILICVICMVLVLAGLVTMPDFSQYTT